MRSEMANGTILVEAAAARPRLDGRAAGSDFGATGLRTLLRYITPACPPPLAARMIALATSLSDEQVDTLAEFLRVLDDRAVASSTEEAIVTWQRILAHLPGLAPALELVRAHVLDVEESCHVCTDSAPD
jgi:hypothetical protein